MNRTPWTVEEELSRLKAEIQEKQGEAPPERGTSREDGPQQQIQGHHNVQVAGDLTVHARKEVNPNHPDALRCPQCQGLTYRRSDVMQSSSIVSTACHHRANRATTNAVSQ
ncbi:MAG: hypothetical protein M0Z99_07860 [Betaproteobacteria bacterium]|nr:hypothetical protein [Betaproteobacteria bacterium]